MGSKVTLRDIADEAKVSRMAVSMALRGSAEVSPETAQRILLIAKKLGYVPNPELNDAMRALRYSTHHKHEELIAFIAHDDLYSPMQSPTVIAYHEGVKERAHEMGFKIKEFTRNTGADDSRISAELRKQGIFFLILAPLPPDRIKERINFEWDQFLTVALGNSIVSPTMHRACPNHFDGVNTSVRALAAKGLRRIAYAVSLDNNKRTGGKSFGSYLKACRDLGLEEVLPYRPQQIKERGFARWLDQTKPQAVIGIENQMANWIAKQVKVTRDSVVFAHLSLTEELRLQGFSGISYDFTLVGKAAVNLMIGAILDGERGIPKHERLLEISGNWIDERAVE